MRLRRIKVLACLAGVMVGTAASAQWQERPDFTGTWKAIDYNEERLRISEDGSSMTIVRTIDKDIKAHSWEAPLTYALDGSETENRVTLPNGTTWLERSRARWVAAAFEVTTTMITDRGTYETMTLYYLDQRRRLVRLEIGTDIRGADITALRPVEFERASP